MATVLDARLQLSKEEKQDEPVQELQGLTIKDVRKILLDVNDQDAPLADLRIDNECLKYWLIENYNQDY